VDRERNIRNVVWERKMSETCKICKGNFLSGIWIAPQFVDEKVLLFCSEKCKTNYVDMKLMKIKSNYPRFHEKIVKSIMERKKSTEINDELWEMVRGVDLQVDLRKS
jgi:ribosomal protein L24E